MAVVIKQLIIRAIAEPSRPPAAAEGAALRSAGGSSDDRDAIVEACVREVVRELERRRRR